MPSACLNLAWQYLRGTGAPQDETQGRALLQRACDLGDASACDELVRRGGDPERYCDLWGAEACYTAVVNLSHARGENADSAEAIVLRATRAARRGSVAARNTTAHLYRDNDRWCRAGRDIKSSCTFAGLLDAEVARSAQEGSDEQRTAAASARDALAKACAAGSNAACNARDRVGAR
jgi:TPR repeat protein